MRKKSKDPFEIPDIPDIPGLEDDERASGSSAPGASGSSGGKRRPGGGGSGGGRGGGGRGGGATVTTDGGGPRHRRGLFFLLGLLLGIAGTILLPPLAGDYLGPDVPAFLGGGGEEVTGPVLGKRQDEGRLLLTVATGQGAMLATFTERVPEIDLLVSEGDTVRLGVARYAPFVEDPRFLGIRKGAGPAAGAAGEAPAGPAREEPAAETSPADTPAVDTSAADTSAADTPAVDTAAADRPAARI